MGSRVQLYLSYPQEMGFSKVENACVFFFPCKIIFLYHKYTSRSYVCLNGKNRACSPNLILKICVFSVQTIFLFCFCSGLGQAPRLWGKTHV